MAKKKNVLEGIGDVMSDSLDVPINATLELKEAAVAALAGVVRKARRAAGRAASASKRRVGARKRSLKAGARKLGQRSRRAVRRLDVEDGEPRSVGRPRQVRHVPAQTAELTHARPAAIRDEDLELIFRARIREKRHAAAIGRPDRILFIVVPARTAGGDVRTLRARDGRDVDRAPAR